MRSTTRSRKGAVASWERTKFADGLVQAREEVEGLDPVRIGQEATVEDEIGVEGDAVFVAEGHHRGAHGRVGLVGEELEDADTELVDVELTGVDDHIGPVADGLQPLPFVGDGLLDLGPGDGMAPAGALEPPDEDVLGCVEIDHPDPVAAGPELVDGLEGLLDLTAATTDHEGDPVLTRSGSAHRIGHLGEQGGGHVVDHIPARVLEGRRRRRAAGAGEAGDEDVVGQHRPWWGGQWRAQGGVVIGGDTPTMPRSRSLEG